MEPVVVTSRLSKRFGRVVAVSELDLSVERGEVFGLVGPNGAGKTTTMRMLLDVVRPTAGSARVLGEDPRAGGAALRRRVGYLPGELRLESRATGRDLLRFYARVSRERAGAAATFRRAEGLAERFELDLGTRVGALSKGNKQKLGLVQAFMHAPELLVLDEPTSGLDPLMQREFQSLAREAQAAGKTILLSSHVLSEVQAVAGRVALLREGRLAKVAAVAELRALAPRRLRLRVAPDAAPMALEALRAVAGVNGLETAADDDGANLTGRLTGSPSALLRAMAGLPVLDFALAEPDLEEAVLPIYERGGE